MNWFLTGLFYFLCWPLILTAWLADKYILWKRHRMGLPDMPGPDEPEPSRLEVVLIGLCIMPLWFIAGTLEHHFAVKKANSLKVLDK